MATSNVILVIVALLTVSQLHNANAAVKSSSQLYYYPEKHIFYNNYAMKDGNLVYVVCVDNHNDKITKLTCRIVQRKFPYDNVAHSCNVTLQVTDPGNDNITKPHVHAFGQDNAILIWGEMGSRSTFNMMAIQMNVCKTKSWQLNDPYLSTYSKQLYTHKILTYDNEFDIFVDSNAVMDGLGDDENEIGMRMSFDREPQLLFDVIKKNEETGEEVTFMSPIATRSPDKGYVYIAMVQQGSNVVLVKPDGTRKLLSSDIKGPILISANYNYITLCARSGTESQMTCTQYDENGEIKLKVPIADHDKKSYFVSVHTTPHGGFLLLTASLDVNYNAVGYDVLKVDSEGRKMGSVRSIGFTESTEMKEILNIWENGNEYCTTFVRQLGSQWDNLQINVDCFSDNDFSV